MKLYEFTLRLQGQGETQTEAAADAIEAFCSDPGIMPDGIIVEHLQVTDESEVSDDAL